MITSKVEYLGNLSTKCTHVRSGVEIVTDAPVDNNGKGESFSPTDMAATAYVSCMITIIGIYCDKNGLPFNAAKSEITKHMSSSPRRISGIDIELDLSGNGWSSEEITRIIRAGESCPVALTFHPEVTININYTF